MVRLWGAGRSPVATRKFANQADRFYHHFKSLVGNGRNMNMKAVEKIAKGRVYTGEQAHKIGLVDKLGGLEDAVAFAQENYTESGDAQIVQWPPKKSFWEFLGISVHTDVVAAQVLHKLGNIKIVVEEVCHYGLLALGIHGSFGSLVFVLS